jgi:hypothetical protein
MIDLMINLQINIDFHPDQFQTQLLELLLDTMDISDMGIEDTNLVKQCLTLWVACIQANPSLLPLFLDSAGHNPLKSKFLESLVLKGLMSKEYRVRESYSQAIEFIVDGVDSSTSPICPLTFFLKLLIHQLDQATVGELAHSAKLYFQLLKDFLPRYFQK